MNLPELINALQSSDVRLGLWLTLDSPEGVLTPDLRSEIERLKIPLAVFLAREIQWGSLRDVRWGPAADGQTPGIEVGSLLSDFGL